MFLAWLALLWSADHHQYIAYCGMAIAALGGNKPGDGAMAAISALCIYLSTKVVTIIYYLIIKCKKFYIKLY